jgi:hypothetical protein
VRPGLLAPLPLHLAEFADLGHGRGAGGQRAGDRAPRRPGGPRPGVVGRGGRGVQGADPWAVRAAGAPVLRDRPAVGRRRDRPGADPHRARPSRPARTPRWRRSAMASSACDPVLLAPKARTSGALWAPRAHGGR